MAARYRAPDSARSTTARLTETARRARFGNAMQMKQKMCGPQHGDPVISDDLRRRQLYGK